MSFGLEVVLNPLSNNEDIAAESSLVISLRETGEEIPLSNLSIQGINLEVDNPDISLLDQVTGKELQLGDLTIESVNPDGGERLRVKTAPLLKAISAYYSEEPYKISSPETLQRQTIVKKINLPHEDRFNKDKFKNVQYETEIQKLASEGVQVRDISMHDPIVDEPYCLIAMDNGGYTLSSLMEMQPSDESKQYTHEKNENGYQPQLPEDQVRVLGRQMLKQLQSIHTKGICHRDIKPDNILIDNKGKISLVDFGLAKQNDQAIETPDDPVFSGGCGTPEYVAPEVIADGEQSLKGDVWSMGMTLTKLFLGFTPQIIQSNATGSWQFDADTYDQFLSLLPEHYGLSSDAVSLLISMTKINPKKRCSAEQALKHPYFHMSPASEMSIFELQDAHREAFQNLIKAELKLEEQPDNDDHQNRLRYLQHRVVNLQRCAELRQQINACQKMLDSPDSLNQPQSEIDIHNELSELKAELIKLNQILHDQSKQRLKTLNVQIQQIEATLNSPDTFLENVFFLIALGETNPEQAASTLNSWMDNNLGKVNETRTIIDELLEQNNYRDVRETIESHLLGEGSKRSERRMEQKKALSQLKNDQQDVNNSLTKE